MNIARLREIQARFAAAAADLESLIAEAEKERDPLAAHIFRARISYQVAAERDQTKSQKRVEWEVDRSYQEALKLGYRGQRGHWLVILFSRSQPG